MTGIGKLARQRRSDLAEVGEIMLAGDQESRGRDGREVERRFDRLELLDGGQLHLEGMFLHLADVVSGRLVSMGPRPRVRIEVSGSFDVPRLDEGGRSSPNVRSSALGLWAADAVQSSATTYPIWPAAAISSATRPPPDAPTMRILNTELVQKLNYIIGIVLRPFGAGDSPSPACRSAPLDTRHRLEPNLCVPIRRSQTVECSKTTVGPLPAISSAAPSGPA